MLEQRLSTNSVGFDFYFELPSFPDFPKLEAQVQEFWQKAQIINQYLTQNQHATEQFAFFDGPITANNAMGVSHAWGRTLKDAYLRYHTLQGKRVRYQNGFDTQGLWVEVEVEKAKNLKSKKDIYEFGLERFRLACLARVQKYGELIGEASKVLGQWMDWENSYWTHSDSNIEHIWFFLKTCHDRGWLYKGAKVMGWCTRCGTSLSQHEQMDSYQEMTHPSVFVSFSVSKPSNKLSERFETELEPSPNLLSFVVWTTTPWTLPANVAVAVHPELRYTVLQSRRNRDQYVLVGETAYERLAWLQEDYKARFSLEGTDLVGTLLEGPCQPFVPKQEKVVVQVVPWDEVSDTEGTGLVHIAPGCGAEDYDLGKELCLPVLAPLDEAGNFVSGYGFDGKSFKEVNGLVRQKLAEAGKLMNDSQIVHRYPICWRCDEELVFRLVEEWFISTKEIRPFLLEAVETVHWSPPSLKPQMVNWLENMGDWCISRKRFWGLPLPFYECKRCGTLQVFSRLHEFWQAAGFSSEEEFREEVPDLHRPYLDNVPVPCLKCGESVPRVTAVGDCWLDAGIVPFSTLNYLQDYGLNSYWDQWFPADYVVEMREQVRLWFYSLLFISVTLTGKAPYKIVQGHEGVFDRNGKPFSKTKNPLLWVDVAKKEGTDSHRWFYAGWPLTKPVMYEFKSVKESLKPFFTFWSCVRFLQQNLRLSPFVWNQLTRELTEVSLSSALDAWFVSRLQEVSCEVHQAYRDFNVQRVVKLVSQFWDEVSRWWLRNSRKRFWQMENENAATTVPYQLLWNAVRISLQWLAPIVPHVTEYLYQVVVRPASSDFPESLHLLQFRAEKFPRLSKLLKEAVQFVPEVWKLVELGRQARQLAKVKNRYTLPSVWVQSLKKSNKSVNMVSIWQKELKVELNVSNVCYGSPPNKRSFPSASNAEWVCWLDTQVSEEQRVSWYQADVLRTVQYLRKQAQLETGALATVSFESTNSLFLKRLLSSEFLKVLRDEAFIEVVEESERNKSWLKKRVKGLEKSVYVFLKPVSM